MHKLELLLLLILNITLWPDTNQANMMNSIPDLETMGNQSNLSCIKSKAQFSKVEKHKMGCRIMNMFDCIKSHLARTDNNRTEGSDTGTVRRKIHCNCCTNITNNSVSNSFTSNNRPLSWQKYWHELCIIGDTSVYSAISYQNGCVKKVCIKRGKGITVWNSSP